MDPIDLADKLSQFNEYWSPRIVGEVNDSYVKLAKLNGDFVWHSHEHEDELFLVAHRGLRDVPRVRVVWDFLLEEVGGRPAPA